MVRLLVQRGGGSAEVVELPSGEYVAGREPNVPNSWRIEDDLLSRRHCQIVVDASTVIVKDLESTNGTFIDGRRIQEQVLEPGQELKLGSVIIHLHEEAPPLLLPPPPDSTPAGPGPGVCANHDAAPARFFCPRCRTVLCSACAPVTVVSGARVQRCAHCRTVCLSIHQAAQLATAPAVGTFFQELPGAFKYPLRKDGAILLLGGAVFFGVLHFLLRRAMFLLALQLAVITYGYLMSYLQNVIVSTAQGDAEPPSWPDLTDFISDLVVPFVQFVVLLAVCLGPGIGLWVYDDELSVRGWLVLGAGLLYLPMAMLAIAMSSTVTMMNPLIVLPAILKVPKEYFAACGVLGLIVVVRALGEALVPLVLSVVAAPLPGVINIATGMVSLYFLMVEMRILGLLYLSNKARFGWF